MASERASKRKRQIERAADRSSIDFRDQHNASERRSKALQDRRASQEQMAKTCARARDSQKVHRRLTINRRAARRHVGGERRRWEAAVLHGASACQKCERVSGARAHQAVQIESATTAARIKRRLPLARARTRIELAGDATPSASGLKAC